MLSLRERDQPPSKQRLKRHQMLVTSLPCMIVAALLVAAFFTIGHIGIHAIRRDKASRLRGVAAFAADGDGAIIRAPAFDASAADADAAGAAVSPDTAEGKPSQTPSGNDGIRLRQPQWQQQQQQQGLDGGAAATERAARKPRGEAQSLHPVGEVG